MNASTSAITSPVDAPTRPERENLNKIGPELHSTQLDSGLLRNIGAGNVHPEQMTAVPETKTIRSGWLTCYPYEEFINKSVPATPWLIEPFLPLGGIVFLHGQTSTGKSPLTWKIATGVSNGGDFFGFPVQTTGTVLLIELDTPSNLVHPRLKKLIEAPRNMHIWDYGKPLNIMDLPEQHAGHIVTLNKNLKPVLVIVNTLRKSHLLDDKQSETAQRIYGEWTKYFPHSTILMVHHDKKDPTEGLTNSDQMFSGSQAWANDAQVALHLTRTKQFKDKKDDTAADDDEPYAKTTVRLKITKSQVSDHERYAPLTLQLSPDGSNWTETGPVAYRKSFLGMDTSIPRKDRIQGVMKLFGVGKSAVYEAVKGL